MQHAYQGYHPIRLYRYTVGARFQRPVHVSRIVTNASKATSAMPTWRRHVQRGAQLGFGVAVLLSLMAFVPVIIAGPARFDRVMHISPFALIPLYFVGFVAGGTIGGALAALGRCVL